MKMKLAIPIFLAIFCVSQSVGEDCADYDGCVESIPQAIKAFTKFATKEIKDSKKDYQQLSKRIWDSIKDLNKEIRSGDKKCKDFAVNGNRHRIVAQVIRSCNIARFDREIDPEIQKMLDGLPRDFMSEKDVEKREGYCKVLVEVANFYCKRIVDRRDAMGGCDIDQKVDEIFRQKWMDCINE